MDSQGAYLYLMDHAFILPAPVNIFSLELTQPQLDTFSETF
jgi:hypothetical protein